MAGDATPARPAGGVARTGPRVGAVDVPGRAVPCSGGDRSRTRPGVSHRCPPIAAADLVLLRGPVATMDAARTAAEARGRPRRSDRRGRARRGRARRWSGRGPGSSSSRGRTVTPGFQDAHVHPIHGGPRPAPLRAARRPGAGRGASSSTSPLRRGPPRRALDPRQRLVHGRLPGRHAVARAARPGRAGPAGLPRQPRRARRVGQHAGARARRHRPRHARPRRRPDRARPPTASRRARSTRGRWTSSRGLVPPASHEETGARPPRGAGLPPLARDHRLAGRLDRRARTTPPTWPSPDAAS